VSRLRAGLLRVAGLLGRRRSRQDVDAEFQSHLEMEIEDNLRRGMTPAQARRHALAASGGLQVAREAYRDRTRLPTLDDFAQDVRFAIRMLRKSPGFTATAVLVLALGIGANGALFSLINALLLRPVVAGGEIVGLYSGNTVRPDAFRGFSYPEYTEIREQNAVFEQLVAEGFARAGITENGVTTRASAMLVSSNYFAALGVPLAQGRTFSTAEESPGSRVRVAIVDHTYWRRHGLVPDILGRTVVVNGVPLTIVGVAPEGFHGSMPVLSTDVWLPFGAADLIAGDGAAFASGVSNDRALQTLLLSGRLHDGVSIEEANARLTPLAGALAEAYPQFNRDQRLVVHERSRVGRGPRPRRDTEPLLGATILMAIATLVLIVACLNVANMLMARGSARRQEMAVRIALGGGRGRLLRQLLVEGLLLSAMASVGAIAVGWWAANRLVGSLESIAGVTLFLDVSPDARVVAAVTVACVVSTLVFALGPAWKLSKPNLTSSLKQGTTIGAARSGGTRLPNLLVGIQVALSLALLIAAGAFLRAGAATASSDAGFPLAGGLVVETDARLGRLDENDGRAAFRAVLERLRGTPGIRAASVASIVPLGATREDRQLRHGDRELEATFTVVGSDYFKALSLPVVSGREFMAAEEQGSSQDPVVIVDRMAAERLFGEGDALGQVVELSAFTGPSSFGRIVGIVPSVRDDLLEAPGAHVYVPFGQHYRAEMTLHVRTDPGREGRMLEPVREAIRAADERLPILATATLTTHRDSTLALWAVLFAAKLFTAFGTIALVLATVGVYGLRAYLVTQRTRELGIRMALGATRGRVIGQLLREGARVATVGMLAGVALALGLIQLLRQSDMLYEARTFDPAILIGASLLLVSAVAVASYIPARRAVRIDPAVALRPE
jgi:predicted permease